MRALNTMNEVGGDAWKHLSLREGLFRSRTGDEKVGVGTGDDYPEVAGQNTSRRVWVDGRDD